MRKTASYRIVNASDDPYITIGSASTSNDFWKWGRDNLLPVAISELNRKSAVHRGILNSKARYIAGKGLTCDEKNLALLDLIQRANPTESLSDVIRKITFDRQAFGNAVVEIVTKRGARWINLYHQDITRCRLSKDKKYILLHPNWKYGETEKAKRKQIPIYPLFEEIDGYLRSAIHIKDYEPEFENYGLMNWAAGLNVSAIAYKTDKWNISRLDNSFNLSGVLVVAGEFQSDEDYEAFKDDFESKFTGEGKQGKILMLSQRPGAEPDAGTRFVPVTQGAEGDWKELHGQSTTDLIIAHGWFRSLAGIADNTGFDTQRILNEYEIALNTVILDEQAKLLSLIGGVITSLLRIDTSTLTFINRPPATAKPQYMRIWEARKADGMEYDETDPAQQEYLANLSKPKTVTI